MERQEMMLSANLFSEQGHNMEIVIGVSLIDKRISA
jgi:hypothetical protein